METAKNQRYSRVGDWRIIFRVNVSRKTLFAWAKWRLFEWVAEKSDARLPLEQHIKASESDRMTKCLILYKDKGQRTWIWKDLVRNFYLCDISSVGNLADGPDF